MEAEFEDGDGALDEASRQLLEEEKIFDAPTLTLDEPTPPPIPSASSTSNNAIASQTTDTSMNGLEENRKKMKVDEDNMEIEGSDRIRFVQELEFVQCLANAKYLNCNNQKHFLTRFETNFLMKKI